MFSEDEIEQYLRDTYGELWSRYLAAWRSDKLFWAMLREARVDTVLRAPSTQLSPGIFGFAAGSFAFNGVHQLHEYQGYGPYNLTDRQGNTLPGHGAMGIIEANPIDLDGLREETWEQPIYRYGATGPTYSGYNRRVTYEPGRTRLDLSAGDSIPYLIGGGAAEFVLSSLGAFAICPECAVVIPVAAAATAANNSISTQYALTVSMLDKRTYLQAPNQCYVPPPNGAADLWK